MGIISHYFFVGNKGKYDRGLYIGIVSHSSLLTGS